MASFDSPAITLKNVIVLGNEAQGGAGDFFTPDGLSAEGGGMYVLGGSLSLINTTFLKNIAKGGEGFSPEEGPGGFGGDGSPPVVELNFRRGFGDGLDNADAVLGVTDAHPEVQRFDFHAVN